MKIRLRRPSYREYISSIQPYQIKLLKSICWNNQQYNFNQLLKDLETKELILEI